MPELITQHPLEVLLTESKKIRLREAEEALKREEKARMEKLDKERKTAAGRFASSVADWARSELHIIRELTPVEIMALAPHARMREARRLVKGVGIAVGAPCALGALAWAFLGFQWAIAVVSPLVIWEIAALLCSFSTRPDYDYGEEYARNGFLTQFFRKWVTKPFLFLAHRHYGRFAHGDYSGSMDEIERKLFPEKSGEGGSGDAS